MNEETVMKKWIVTFVALLLLFLLRDRVCGGITYRRAGQTEYRGARKLHQQ